MYSKSKYNRFSKKCVVLLISIILLIMAFLLINQENLSLSTNQINNLRRKFVFYPSTSSLASSYEPTLSEQIKTTDTFVYGEILSDKYHYNELIHLDSPMEASYVGFRLKVLEDSNGLLNKDDVIFIESSGIFEETIPEFSVGDKVVVPINNWFIDGNINRYNIGSTGMFYVTEENFVLSVYNEPTAESLTGICVKELLAEVRKWFKNASKLFLNFFIRSYCFIVALFASVL